MRLIRLGIAPAALLGLAATAVLAQDPTPPSAPPAPPPPVYPSAPPAPPATPSTTYRAVAARLCAAAGHPAGACACPVDAATSDAAHTAGPACAASHPSCADTAGPACTLPPLLGRARLCLARHLRSTRCSGPNRTPAGKDRAKPARASWRDHSDLARARRPGRSYPPDFRPRPRRQPRPECRHDPIGSGLEQLLRADDAAVRGRAGA